MPRRYKIFGFVAGLVILLDQITKAWARGSLGKYGFEGYTVVQNYFDLRLSFNTGSAFGLFSSVEGARWFLTAVGIGALFAIVYILRKGEDHQKWMTTALGLIAGGAVGNVIDRILFGKVTDFVVWKIPWEGAFKEWPAFNIADSALVVGVLIMFLDVGREQKKAREDKALKEKSQA